MADVQPPELSQSDFELTKKLGEGATSVVWRSGDLALKIGHDKSSAASLASEALFATLALSPRLPELVDLGMVRVVDRRAATIDNHKKALPFIALRLVEGVSLDRASDPDPFIVARDVGAALADLHDVGLAHGDIKPANISIQKASASLLDLGLACDAAATAIQGATPRYLARGDRGLGDARARDMLALGLVLAELISPEVRDARRPLDTARTLAGSTGPIAAIIAALLAPEPGARPSARWVAAHAASAARGNDDMLHGARRVRARYLRLRRQEIGSASGSRGAVASWLDDAIAITRRVRAMCTACHVKAPAGIDADPDRELGPMTPEQRTRWLVSLVGSAAAVWPTATLHDLSEPELADMLSELADKKRPEVWTAADLEGDVQSVHIADGELDVALASKLSLAIRRVPPDPTAIEIVERKADIAPPALVLATADVLRLSGELGRARSLVIGLQGGAAIAADVLRRSGDIRRAKQAARAGLDDDPDGRARGVLARLAFDAGELDEAVAIIGRPRHAATAEVAALIATARGNVSEALALAKRGAALAQDAEAHARMSATLAYVKRHHDPPGAREGFKGAVVHAVRAGAVLEEASYRTGEAASCVDLGELEPAIETAKRAALLWEDVLGRPATAARAWLARAAAYAAIHARHETIFAAEHAISRARAAADKRAEAYALWSIADVHDTRAGAAIDAARRSAALIDAPTAADEEATWTPDAVQTAARVLRHAPDDLDARQVEHIDTTCADRRGDAFARLAWWGARGERQLSASGLDAGDARLVLTELAALADAPAPIATRGETMAIAARLAAALGDTDVLSRVDGARQLAAQTVLQHTQTFLAEAARGCPWLSRPGATVAAGAPAIAREQALDLQQLVRALSDRSDLGALLDRVVDVLLLWTRAERGLLLLKEGTDGKLSARSARNIRHDDLHDEQLAVSTSLAERAIASGEPVVAIDAMEELSSSYDSVHALKLRSVLVIPLLVGGATLGVVYLDDRLRRGAFGDQEVAWAQAVAPVAALAISDARTQDELRRAVARAEQARTQVEHSLAIKESALDVAERELARAAGGSGSRFANIIGDSEPMRQLLHLVERVAPSDVPILLRGESGSGKELVAHAIHRASARAARAFVGENCGALPETLLESTLFGHVKGAFTGAHRPRIGLFEAADGGTLFLDEIGEMSFGMQTKLLRVLEDNMVRPVGSTNSKKVDVRIIAATHRDLEAMVKDKSFREDLYYRLNVITIPIPALRERSSDIPLLVDHLLGKHAPGARIRVTKSAMAKLSRHPWPGNVRQLENEIRRALLLAEDTIDPSHLSFEGGGARSEAELGLNVRARIDELEVKLVSQALERTGGNQTQAAKLLGVSRYGLHKMIKRLGIKKG